jgi:hypothetical protein
LNDEACLGQNPPENDPLGSCAEGYQGILCTNCQIGYSKQGSEQLCKKCPGRLGNAIKIFVSGIVCMLGLVFLIQTTYKNALKVKNYTTVYNKITLNHLQMMTIVLSLDFHWPRQVEEFFRIASPITEITT